MIITISGNPGTGKTVIGKELAKKLGYKFFSAGKFFRKIAEEKGISVVELNRRACKNPDIDKEVDSRMRALKNRKNIVVEGHISALILPHADYKIKLTTSLWERVRRVADRDNISLISSLIQIKRRERLEAKRFRKRFRLYGGKGGIFNLVINTTGQRVSEAVNIIIKKIGVKKK